MKKIVLLLALSISFSFASNALTRTSIANGNWSDPFIWSPNGVPNVADDTIIVATGVNFNGQNIYFGNSLFKVAISGSLTATVSDTLTFGGEKLEINGYTAMGVMHVGAGDSVVNNSQIDVNELTQGGTMINNNWICVSSQLITSDEFQNNGSVSCTNWVNSARVTGTQGQFCISQNLINTDQMSGSIDVCDASPGGFGDVNTGWYDPSVTFCAVGPCASCIQPGFEENIKQIGISIVPHPVTNSSLIILETELLRPNTESIFRIIDVQGRVVREISFIGNQLSFERTGMQSGLYFYWVMLSDGSVAAGKLAVE